MGHNAGSYIGDRIKFSCTYPVSNSNLHYNWYKDGNLIQNPPSDPNLRFSHNGQKLEIRAAPHLNGTSIYCIAIPESGQSQTSLTTTILVYDLPVVETLYPVMNGSLRWPAPEGNLTTTVVYHVTLHCREMSEPFTTQGPFLDLSPYPLLLQRVSCGVCNISIVLQTMEGINGSEAILRVPRHDPGRLLMLHVWPTL